MLHDLVLGEDFVEHFQRAAAIAHEIFTDDLEPVAGRLFRENVGLVRHAQADADAEVREVVEAVGGHGLGKFRKT
jgi:hypothetical protein